jgi:hypothetical protein
MSIVKIRAALEVALNAMPGIIPSVTITSSTAGSNTSFVTDVPHGLTSGLSVTITGHSESTLNGTYLVIVTGLSAFTLQHKVTKHAITSVASGVGGVITANLTAWEAVPFETLIGVPYQRVNLLAATPENPTFGSGFHREIGYFQIMLCYPDQYGVAAIMARAELIRSTFKRGFSFTKDGIIVNVSKTPIIMPGFIQDMVYVVAVKVPYWADIFE